MLGIEPFLLVDPEFNWFIRHYWLHIVEMFNDFELLKMPRRIAYFNPLQMKHRPLYLKTQFVPRCKHFSSRL